MGIKDIRFHQWLGIEDAEAPFIFGMQENPDMLNHVGSIHACIQLTLAEASAGEFLRRQFINHAAQLIPVVRKNEGKFSKPANGKLMAMVDFYNCNKDDILKEIESKSRFSIQTKVVLTDESGAKTLTAVFDWFVVKKE